MKFLVDAQLPKRLAAALVDHGHDAVHTSELPAGNRTSDAELCELADREGRVVVTKDNDFRASHLLRGTPRQLLLVTTGNIANDALLALVEQNLAAIVEALTEARFVELTATAFIVRENR